MTHEEILIYLQKFTFKSKKGYSYKKIEKDYFIMNKIDNILDCSLKNRTIREKILLLLDFENINSYICEVDGCNNYKYFNLKHFKWHKTCCSSECKKKIIKDSNIKTYNKCETNNIKNLKDLNDYNFLTKDIYEFINDSTGKQNIRFSNIEYDLYYENKQFAIEYDDILFHSFGKSKYSMLNNYNKHDINKYKHLEKTQLLEEKGFQLFHIFENEWKDQTKKEIWKSVINNKLGRSIKIGARKCTIKEINYNTAKDFLNNNHLQGAVNSSINIGLYYKDELVSLMTLGKSRYNKNVEYELYRFCNKINTTVQGSASKLLKYFERNYNPKSIISYANRRWSKGNLYEKLEFEFIKNSRPNKFYLNENNYFKLESRIAFQKHKLEKKLEHYDESLSSIENILNNKYRVIYDCGNKTYIKLYKQKTNTYQK